MKMQYTVKWNNKNEENVEFVSRNKMPPLSIQQSSSKGLHTQTSTYDVSYKLLIVGESRVGKSSIIKRISLNNFQESTISTVGLDFVNLFIQVDNLAVKLQVWDTAGQERFRTITRNQFKNTKGILLIYDLCDRDSFNSLEYWINNLSLSNNDNEIVYLIGNKLDLSDTKRQVLYQEGKKLADRNSIKFFETSAKTAENLTLIFQTLAYDLVETNDMNKLNKYSMQQVNHLNRNSFVYDYTLQPIILINDTKNSIKRNSNNKLVKNIFRRAKHGRTINKSTTQQSFQIESNKRNTLNLNSETCNYSKSTTMNKSKNKKIKSKKKLSCCKIS